MIARYDSLKDKDGCTRRERNELFEVDSPAEDVPDLGASLWSWFWDIRQCQAPGFSGPSPISHQEYRAWLDITGNLVTREEVAVLKAMDARFCEEIDKESEAIREREQEA